MATIRPGPLVSEISGSIAGTSFLNAGASQLARARAKPIETHAQTLNNCRNLLRGAGSLWSALSAADRQKWAVLAASVPAPNVLGQVRHYSPFGLFCAAVLHQADRPVPVIPPLPAEVIHTAPVSANAADFSGSLYLSSLSRQLAAGEQLLAKTYRAYPAHWLHPPLRIVSTVEALGLSGLNPIPDASVSFSGAGSYMDTTTANPGNTIFTVEFWFNPPAWPVAGIHSFFRWSTLFHTITNNNGDFRLYTELGSYSWGAPPISVNTWHHLAMTFAGSPGHVDLFLDGAKQGAGFTATYPGLLNGWKFASFSASLYPFVGRLDECHIHNSVLTAPQIAAIYNTGRGIRGAVSAGTIALYHCDSIPGGQVLDSSPNAYHLTAHNAALAPGMFCQLIYPAALRPIPGPCLVPVVAYTGFFNLFFGPRSQSAVVWI